MRRIVRHISRLALLPFFLAALFLLSNTLTAQQSPETWLDDTKHPTIAAGKVFTDSEYTNVRQASRGVFNDLECEQMSVPFSSYQFSADGLPFEGCWFSTDIGLLEKGGYAFQPNGWEVGGYINSFNSQLFPTKHPKHFIEFGQTIDFGSQVTIRRSDRFVDETQVTPADTGWPFPVFLEWVKPTTGLTLAYQDGTPWQVSDSMLYDQIGYSENGKHMIIWHNDGYVVLVDFETLTLKTIAIGYDSYFELSISNSGRYLAVSTPGVQGVKVIDTEKCSGGFSGHVTSPMSCANRTFDQTFLDQYSELNHVYGGGMPTFYGDDLLGYYLPQPDGSYYEYVLRAPNTHPGTNYIAMGDSYTSGEGAYHYIHGTDEPNNRCHLSEKSYPYLLGNNLGMDSIHSVACSSARTYHIFGDDIRKAAQNKKPSDRSKLGKWLPGYKWQLDHLRDDGNSVDVVSLGIGGNDIGFSDKVTRCVWVGDCYSSFVEKYEIAEEISDKFDTLVELYINVRNTALERSRDSRVYVLGYPQVVEEGGNCGNNVRLSSSETEFANHLIQHLNAVIKRASERAGVVYISIENVFDGHKLCQETASPAVNGITGGDGAPPFIRYPFASESFHPTAYGHELIYKAIKKRTNNLRDPLPFPDKNISAPEAKYSLLVSQSSDIPHEIRKLLYGEDLIDDVIFKQDEQLAYAEGGYYRLKTNSVYIGYFTSEPTFIGNFLSDDLGNLAMRFKIPAEVEPGIHTLHIYGKNIAEEDIDIYKTVFIAETPTDWNGDGILDLDDPCGIFEALNKDENGDGVDDGCDDILTSQTNTPSPQHVNKSILLLSSSPHSPKVKSGSQQETIASILDLRKNGTSNVSLATNPFSGAKNEDQFRMRSLVAVILAVSTIIATRRLVTLSKANKRIR